ncbi:Cardiolipin synthase 1 (CL synthase 1) [Durusdinium trenchii]|uniref:Cardiolipin synthase 1 (CL synthase 1) n=1 Tax=Durusdinium trenchii TaxID=1381693 RepID=A0ABP0JWQ5_9DINO
MRTFGRPPPNSGLQPNSNPGVERPRQVDETFTHQNFPAASEQTLQLRRQTWASLLYRFQKYGHFSTGNRVQALEGGDACFKEMLEVISLSQTRVWCESYIFDNSRVAEIFFMALREAATRGLDVVLLVDYIGAFALRQDQRGKDWVQELRRAGAEVVFFNPVLPASLCVGPISFRDHRKIMICDDVGFCGGMNIQEEVGEETFGTSRFYDVHAKLEGPCVADLAEVFRDSLKEAGGHVHRNPIQVPELLEPGVYVQILQSNVRQRRRTLQKVMQKSIDAASESVLLTTAYFFPPTFLKAALLRVPTRGAHLSLLLSGSSDFFPLPGDLLAQSHFLRSFLRDTPEDKVSVHLYEQRHMHAKHMCVDGVFSTIGSFNFDLYSDAGDNDRSARRRSQWVSVGPVTSYMELHLKRLKESRRTLYISARVAAESACRLLRWMRIYHQPLVRAACAVAFGLVRLSGRNVFDGLDCFQRKWLLRKATLTFLLEEQSQPQLFWNKRLALRNNRNNGTFR